MVTVTIDVIPVVTVEPTANVEDSELDGVVEVCSRVDEEPVDVDDDCEAGVRLSR